MLQSFEAELADLAERLELAAHRARRRGLVTLADKLADAAAEADHASAPPAGYGNPPPAN